MNAPGLTTRSPNSPPDQYLPPWLDAPRKPRGGWTTSPAATLPRSEKAEALRRGTIERERRLAGLPVTPADHVRHLLNCRASDDLCLSALDLAREIQNREPAWRLVPGDKIEGVRVEVIRVALRLITERGWVDDAWLGAIEEPNTWVLQRAREAAAKRGSVTDKHIGPLMLQLAQEGLCSEEGIHQRAKEMVDDILEVRRGLPVKNARMYDIRCRREVEDAETLLQRPIPGDTLKSQMKRLSSVRWWKRVLRKTARQAHEIAAVHHEQHTMKWCSPRTREWQISSIKATEKWARKHAMVPDDGGEEVPMDVLIEGGPRRRYAELLARSKGIATLADREGLTPHLITITVPGEMHRTSENWTGAIAPDHARWFQKGWRRLTRWAQRHSEMQHWIVACQPHRDGSAHWHVVAWLRSPVEAETKMREVFRAGAGESEDRQRHGLDFKKIEGGSGGAVAYASRVISYIARTTDQHEGTTDDQEEAERATAWASTWSLRRFRTSHSRVTLWREMRRKDVEISGSAEGKAAQACARDGNYAGFLQASLKAGAKVVYAEGRNGYGDTSETVCGVQIGGTNHIRTRWWTLQRTHQPRRVALSDAVNAKYQGEAHRRQEPCTPTRPAVILPLRRPPPTSPPARIGPPPAAPPPPPTPWT